MNKKKLGWLTLSTFALTTLIAYNPVLIAKVTGQSQISATSKIGDGLNTTVFDTPNGKISVNLPEDMATGDTLSGTVIAEPVGQTAKEKEENEDELNGYVVEVKKAQEPAPPQEKLPPDCPPPCLPPGFTMPPIIPISELPPEECPPEEEKPCPGEKKPPCTEKKPPKTASKPPCTGSKPTTSKNSGTCSKPAPPISCPVSNATPMNPPTFVCGLGRDPIDLVLTRNGQPVCSKPVPHPQKPINPGYPPGGCTMPTAGQTGKPITIGGGCDGYSGNTGVKCGGVKCPPLAEGPRGTVVKSPGNVVGPTDITFTECGRTAKGKYCNLKVKMSAPKTVLKKGESTTVTVMVYGVEGLAGPVELRIENRSPNVIDMQGGNSQVITINPSSGGQRSAQ